MISSHSNITESGGARGGHVLPPMVISGEQKRTSDGLGGNQPPSELLVPPTSPCGSPDSSDEFSPDLERGVVGRSSEGSFTPEMIHALEATARSFQFRTYVKELAPGDVRAVVLVGETHAKGASASDAGMKLLEAFPVRGLEGLMTGETVCGRIRDAAFRPVMGIIQFVVARVKGVRGSSIDDALCTDARDSKGNPVSTTNIHLEMGNTPVTLWGEVSKLLLAVPVLSVTFPIGALAARMVPYYGASIQSALVRASDLVFYPLSISVGGVVVANLIPEQWRRNKIIAGIHGALALSNTWVIGQRNELMVNNLIAHAEGAEYRSPVLTIVGRMHVSGMGDLLEQRGWSLQQEAPR